MAARPRMEVTAEFDGGAITSDHTNHSPGPDACLGERAHMATKRNEIDPEEQNPPWLGFTKFLYIVILTVTAFLLTRSMVRHHFFSGGQMNRHDVTGP
jgi:hypothetical protein